VATFYNQFHFSRRPVPRPGLPGNRVPRQRLGRGARCIRQELEVEPGETTRDGSFSLEVVACIGACGLAPVITVNGECYPI